MEFISHPGISVLGRDGGHRPDEAAFGVHVSKTVFGVEGRFGLEFESCGVDCFLTHLNYKQDMYVKLFKRSLCSKAKHIITGLNQPIYALVLRTY
jgi:hypothetical protein